jgi:hypothetical protein
MTLEGEEDGKQRGNGERGRRRKARGGLRSDKNRGGREGGDHGARAQK